MKRFVFAADNGGWTTYDVSTNVIPIIDVDAYGGILSSFFYSSDMVILDDSLDDFWNQVVDVAMDIIQRSFNELGIPAKVVSGSGSMYHPREYNFECDELNFSISVDNAWINDSFEEYKDDPYFLEFIKQRYSSRDGFISFFPSDAQGFIKAFESPRDKWKTVCQMITYHIDDSTYRDNNEELEEYLSSNPNFDMLYLGSSPSGIHSGSAEELIEDYKANPAAWDEYDVDWLREYAKYEEVPFESVTSSTFASSGSAKNWNNPKRIKGKKQGNTFISEEFTGTMDSQKFWDDLADLAKKEDKFIFLDY